MKITAILNPEYIISELEPATKEEALAELSAIFPRSSFNYDQESMVNVLMEREREKLGSTGMGDSIAIPHGKMRGTDDLLLSFGRSKKGVDFNAINGKPAHLFFSPYSAGRFPKSAFEAPRQDIPDAQGHCFQKKAHRRRISGRSVQLDC